MYDTSSVTPLHQQFACRFLSTSEIFDCITPNLVINFFVIVFFFRTMPPASSEQQPPPEVAAEPSFPPQTEEVAARTISEASTTKATYELHHFNHKLHVQDKLNHTTTLEPIRK